MATQNITSTSANKPELIIPQAPFIYASTTEVAILMPSGEIKCVPHAQAAVILGSDPVITCHAPYTAHRIGIKDLKTLDVLELYAFIHPTRFTVPTPAGLAKTLGQAHPTNLEESVQAIYECTLDLMHNLKQIAKTEKQRNSLLSIAEVMALNGNGWGWTGFIFENLGEVYNSSRAIRSIQSLNIWDDLPQWSEEAPPPPPSQHPVTGEESRDRLKELLGVDKNSESRQQQVEYATAMTSAFAPIQEAEEPNIALAEAGTGVGKTLGYLSPASVWAEKNKGSVWISTYTKNLQRQIESELDRLYPNPQIKEQKVTVRKGRENYLCLLNFEEAAAGAGMSRHPNHAIATGLMARWAAETKDGDLTGTSFHGWLPGLVGSAKTIGLSDRRGECIYVGCDHYNRCFVESSIRRSRHAELVIANHALVMMNAALANPDKDLPQRYVFDEGHHLLHAADSAFSGHLTMKETADLRRWVLGAEEGRKSRSKGLKKRCEELVCTDESAQKNLQKILIRAHILPAVHWQKRIKDNAPNGPIEEFLISVFQQTYARSEHRDGPYSLETETLPLNDGMMDKALKAKQALQELQKPMNALTSYLEKRLVDEADTLHPDFRKKIESTVAGLDRRSKHLIKSWVEMLETLLTKEPSEGFIDWMEIERIDGKNYDVGIHRHWIDPMIPFALSMKNHAHGVGITSATLKDLSGNEEKDWQAAMESTGTRHFHKAPHIFSASSPYDYEKNARVYIVTDVRKDDLNQLSSAYFNLFRAANGGALGLFTAISRLKHVHNTMAHKLEHEGFPLYSQHMDAIDTGTLIDMFRENEKSCLLGTDAIRDGVDVPGNSLKLLVFDRMPWPRPTILHKARREEFGKRQYDEMITRMKIKQAFGRLIRSSNDKGIFIMLDSMFPSRLHSAFPQGTEIHRLGIADTIENVKIFLNN